MEEIFFEISLVLIVGTFCATIAKALRQPMIPAYILAGILLGPSVFNVMHSDELMEILSTFGIAFLLFLVGIELDLRNFLKVGKAAIIVGFLQMFFASTIGYIIILLLGFDHIPALFLAIALAFSSTIVVLKTLDERKELDTLYGQIVIGIMLTQDFIAILFLLFFNVFIHPSGASLAFDLGFTFFKAVVLFSIALVSSRYMLKYIFAYFARTAELLFLGSICWCLLFALLAMWLGFSIEVGALIAGVTLSFLPYSIEISDRIRSLRDFFLPIFFAVLGGQLIFNNGFDIFIPTIVISSVVLFVSPLAIIAALLVFGYRSRTSFQAGMAIGQISEFSFILVSLAAAAGIIQHDIVSLVALIGLITMTLSTYMIEYSDQLYVLFRPGLKKLQRKKSLIKLDSIPDHLRHHVVIFGHHTMGYKTREFIEKLGKKVVIVDYNPDIIRQLQQKNISCIYGSMADEEVLEKLHIQYADYIISTVRTHRDTLSLLRHLKAYKVKGQIIVTAQHVSDAIEYYKNGASFVLVPTSMSISYLQDIIKGDISKHKSTHVKELKKMSNIEFVT